MIAAMFIQFAAIRHGAQIVTGRRHREIVATIIRDSQLCPDVESFEFGFVTSTNDFVDRKQAAAIALRAKQIEAPVERLTSQTIWPANERVLAA